MLEAVETLTAAAVLAVLALATARTHRSNDERRFGETVDDRHEQIRLVDGELRFEPLETYDEAVPCKPVTHGFKYV